MQADLQNALPVPDAQSAAHSERCAEHLRQLIAINGGSIGFGSFMQHALYAPGLGYYAAGSTKFGADGDFVTAPEVSPLFGRIVARQCAEVLSQLGQASILEYGAGSGRLAVDILRKLDELEALPEHYRILEVSAELSARQRELISGAVPHLYERVRWVEQAPDEHCGVVIANEVLDAMPVERFTRRESIMQHRVVVDDGRFAIVEAKANDVLAGAVAAIEEGLGSRLPPGYVSEISLGAAEWTRQMLTSLSHGAALLFDYGVSRREYYAADRSGGWLRCHFRHRAHNDPLILPGIQDITAWVDFTGIAEAAVDAGASVAGFANQAMFMIGGGLELELAMRSSMQAAATAELSAAAKMLTLPGSMGEHFKCLCLGKGAAVSLGAFKVADRTHTL